MKPDQTKVDPVRRGAKKKPLIGAVKPRIHSPLLKGASRIDEVADLAEKIGMPLLPWQHFVLEDMLKVDKDGMFVRKTSLCLVSRQQGKTHLARMRILAGLFLFGEKNIIGMSSNRNMALDTFRQICNTVEDHPFLKAQVRQIRYANGQESITLLNGARYQIVAATRDGSRGLSCDLLYIDEAREVSEEAFKAAVPTTRARPNSQTLITSNAGDAFSTVLNNLVSRAKETPSKTFGYYEYSAPMEARQDIHNRKYWAMANPALGHTVTEEAIEESIATNPIEATLTETLCMWIDSQVSPWTFGSIEATSNSDLILPIGTMTVLAFDVSPSKRSGALVGAQITPEGKIGVGVIETYTSEVAIDEIKMASQINEWAMKYRPVNIAYDKYATASIAQRLTQSGHKLIDISGQSFYQACGELSDALSNLRLVHQGQPEWVNSMNNAAMKTNDAGWRIVRRKSAGDVTAAIATAMCVHMLSKPISVPQIYV
jgi:phage terminase large subunit-like protein